MSTYNDAMVLSDELEGMENKIMETGLLSDLVPIYDFDVQLRVYKATGDETSYRLNIDIGCDESISLSDENQSEIGETVKNYVLKKFDFDEHGIDGALINTVTVTVNYGGESD
jgi:hypothetical protein